MDQSTNCTTVGTEIVKQVAVKQEDNNAVLLLYFSEYIGVI
jgi:hypothetical protein